MTYCEVCDGLGFIEATEKRVVWPCEECNPAAYERWIAGDYRHGRRTNDGDDGPTQVRRTA